MSRILTLDIGGSSIKYGIFDSDTFTVDQPLVKRFDSEGIQDMNFSAVEKSVVTAIRNANDAEVIELSLIHI